MEQSLEQLKAGLAASQREKFDLAVQIEMRRTGCTRSQAIAAVARREPQAHADFLSATQPKTRRVGAR